MAMEKQVLTSSNTFNKNDLNEMKDNIQQIVDTIQDPTTSDQIKNMLESLTKVTDSIVQSQSTPQTIMNKLKSRKFWMAMLGAVAGICGMLNSNGNVLAIFIFVILEVISILGYFFAEGTVDATRIKELIQMATQIAGIVGALSPIAGSGSVTDSETGPEASAQNIDGESVAPCNMTPEDSTEQEDADSDSLYGKPFFV